MDVILESLAAAAFGPFFPESDFHIIFGLTRDELKDLANKCNNVSSQDDQYTLAIKKSINNLLGYPHDCEKIWGEYISVTPTELERIYQKWKRKGTE